MRRRGVLFIASIITLALVAPGAGAHDGIMTPEGHAAEDAVVLEGRRPPTVVNPEVYERR